MFPASTPLTSRALGAVRSRTRRRPLLAGAALVAGVALFAACGNDASDASAPPGGTTALPAEVHSRAEWCAVANELERVVDAASADDMYVDENDADMRAGFTDALQLRERLVSGLDQVDASEREAVGQALAFFERLAGAVIAAPDRAGAEAAVGDLYDSAPASLETASTWISSACGIEIGS